MGRGRLSVQLRVAQWQERSWCPVPSRSLPVPGEPQILGCVPQCPGLLGPSHWNCAPGTAQPPPCRATSELLLGPAVRTLQPLGSSAALPGAQVSVKPSVEFAKEQPARSEVQAKAGGSATLSCEVAQAGTEVTWYKDGKKLSASSRVHVEAQGCSRRLVVQQAGRADAGEYSCEAGGQKVSFRLDVAGQKRHGDSEAL
uniref:Ig-like domain-containing protein n=1 Tax=Canis lupus dingo TaxID=286419 RepID=A0A8C0JXP5_CANLU